MNPSPSRALIALLKNWATECSTQKEVYDRLQKMREYAETNRQSASQEVSQVYFTELREILDTIAVLFEKCGEKNEEQSNGIEAELQAERHMTDDERLCREGGSREGTTQTTEKDPIWLSIELPDGENEYPEPHCQVILYSLGYSIGLETKTPQEALTLFNALQTITQIEAD